MAKKIITTNAQKASESLKRSKIEHVLVEYIHKDGERKNDAFVVVLNKNYKNAKAALISDKIDILKTKSVRNYEMKALSHQHYQPQFDCKCRNCGKTFKSTVKEAVWCSPQCKKDFRNKKRAERKTENHESE